ncbi:hypothetical protein XELAEV_18000487mg [Xenopus laevis]|uniref:Uncharacterized protein n=1 Tax=Xenopus laevis TaxID=8355 RepID=A0A974GYV0_XENLA|nr:hypothetical protein XELAEV_18000487mg [Xenopus laevis]
MQVLHEQVRCHLPCLGCLLIQILQLRFHRWYMEGTHNWLCSVIIFHGRGLWISVHPQVYSQKKTVLIWGSKEFWETAGSYVLAQHCRNTIDFLVR